MDTFSEQGSIFCETSVLNKTKLTYNARAKTDITTLSISNDTLELMKGNINDLDESILTFLGCVEK